MSFIEYFSSTTLEIRSETYNLITVKYNNKNNKKLFQLSLIKSDNLKKREEGKLIKRLFENNLN